jgi:hypothetical protein
MAGIYVSMAMPNLRKTWMAGTRPAMTPYYGPRRSAVQEPEHEPPLQEPVPILPASRPEPLALRPPPLTVTVIAPVPPTLPVIVNASLPAFANRPFEIRIGYR